MRDGRFSINILGPLQPKYGDVELRLPGRKLRGILALLAVRAGDEVRRDELIEELDLMRTTGNATNALHAHMTRLRRWLNGHCDRQYLLQSVNSGYRLNVDYAAIDALRFRARVDQALALWPSAPSVVETMLDNALGLWRGDALVDTSDGPIAAAAADELHQMRTAAREVLLDAWIVLGRDQQAIVNARRFILSEPFNERMRAHLITALKRQGRHAEAYESYFQAEKIFNDELGINPGRNLRAALVETH
ncbi:BTAD domain-containing putative transcriptional regulator [Rhodococcus sp. NPDC003318]|uniref:AfsR/SARP family transcriptional regulator n=1 Tax=Rhodococcus sp. NPDC003318 TaxID=3364503 RepID=UPI0036AE7536